MTTGIKEDVYTLSAGDVILQWPSRILLDEYPDLRCWLDLMQRKIKRSVVEDNDSGDEQPHVEITVSQTEETDDG